MNNLQKHAKTELTILADKVPNAILTPFRDEILALCEAVGNSGQSGGSMPYTASAIAQAIEKLLNFQVLSSITGEDYEWNKVAWDNRKDLYLYQNKRDSRIFKDGKEGTAYFIDAIVFDGDIGGRFTGNVNGISSSQYIIEFPFIPKTFYVDVIDHRWKNKKEKVKDPNGDWWTHDIKDESQLKEVFEYYDKM